jgi:hypothetical protein
LAGLVAAAAFSCAPVARAQQAAAAAAKGEVARAIPALSRTGLWLAAAGGTALLAGVSTGFVAKAREHDAWATCRRGSGGRPECPESARADFDAASALATATNVLFLGGGLLGVAGVGLVIVGAQAEAHSTRASLEFTPALALDGPGVAVTGAF